LKFSELEHMQKFRFINVDENEKYGECVAYLPNRYCWYNAYNVSGTFGIDDDEEVELIE
jgi:hypothetical protein